MRLLIVDDSSTMRKLVALLLSPLGCEVIEACSGEEALLAVGQNEVDLVLLDLMMPVRDGLAVLQDLRQREGRWFPIVIMTSTDERSLRVRALTLGADDYLEKPFDQQVLLARVRSLLAVRAAQSKMASHAMDMERTRREHRELTEFLVHDVRTPLAVVSMDLEQVLRETAEAATRETLVEAQRALKRACGMLNDMLEEIGRLEGAGFVAAMEPVDGAALIREVAAPFREEAERRSILIAVEGTTPLPLSAARGLVGRALENLLGNAMRFVPEGGRIRIAAQLEGGAVDFIIANNGPAIPVDHRKSIFEKYVTGAAPAFTGRLGIGLYFCRRVAEIHGGTITVGEPPGWPVEFRLRVSARGTRASDGLGANRGPPS